MITGVAIDIGWFMTVSDTADWDESRAAQEFLSRMLDLEVPMLQDYEGRIAAEYSRYLRETPLGHAFTTKASRTQLVNFVSGAARRACVECLSRIGFDPSDVPYVAVASQVGGVYLTHESKHLDPEQAKLIFGCCQVRVVGTNDLVDLLT